MISPRKIAVVLSGCGNKDGTEITEAVSLMIALSSAGAQVQYFAPDIEIDAKNFLTDSPLGQKRNVLLESARICRGEIKDLKDLNSQDFDGLAFPGGFGAALHLCNWAAKGAACEVHSLVEKVIKEFHAQSKPIAAMCIAPVILAKVLGPFKVTLTLGDGLEIAKEVQKTGAIHESCPVDDYVTDRECKVITTPAYMFDEAKPHEVFKGISGLVKEFIEMA